MKKIQSSKARIAAIVTVIFIVVFSALISFRPFDFIPGWNQIFDSVGLSDVSFKADEYALSVHYIDVGKADAILIQCDGKNMLIDSGNIDPSNKVIEYLKKRNVKNLDLVVATHPDKDHIGSMANIIYEFNIQKFMMPEIPEDIVPKSSVYQSMIYALNSKNLIVNNPVSGDTFTLGNANCNILAPIKQYDDSTNNNSIVIKLNYKNDSFLFVGDAEKEEEQDILNTEYDLKSTVLKVGHHGSKTSTTKEFLEAVAPQYAVICVGEDNNDLPKKSVLDRLTKNGVKTYRTDLNGNIVITTDGSGVNIFTQK